MPSDSLGELTKLVLRFRAQRDWAQFHTPKELAISLVVEASELLELMQWKQGRALERALLAKRDDISDELGDCLHSLLLLSNDLGIDLAQACRRKLKKVTAKYPVHKSRGMPKKYTEL